jgi:YggT family protein
MLEAVFVTFVDLFVMVFYVLLIVRVVMSYFASPSNQLYTVLVSLTEPLLAPLRKVIPATPGVDLAPLVAFLVLQVVQITLHEALGV